MNKSADFEKRLGRITRRHHGARSLFDEALNELDASIAGFELLRTDVMAEVLRLQEVEAEAMKNQLQAQRVSQKIRDLIS